MKKYFALTLITIFVACGITFIPTIVQAKYVLEWHPQHKETLPVPPNACANLGMIRCPQSSITANVIDNIYVAYKTKAACEAWVKQNKPGDTCMSIPRAVAEKWYVARKGYRAGWYEGPYASKEECLQAIAAGNEDTMEAFPAGTVCKEQDSGTNYRDNY